MKKLYLLLLTLVCSVSIALAQTTASVTQFSAVSGTLDDNISYASFQGGGTSAPTVSSKQIRLYQRASQTSDNTIGGYITITAKSGYKISSVSWKNAMTTTYTYSVDEVLENGTTSFPNADANAENGSTSTINNLDCSTITLYARGTSSSTRLYLASLSVTYDEVTIGPKINASDITIESDATSGEIAYTIKNPAIGVNPTAAITTGDWISNVAVNTATGKISFDATANTGAERTATITISYTGATDKVVTVTQKKYVTTTTYNKVSASEMVIGGTYVWYAQKSDGTGKSVATPLGSNTYFGAGALANESSVNDNTLSLTSETPELFIFNQVGESTWTIEDADNAGKYLYVSGDKKLAWNTTKNEWTLSGTTQPAFACKSYNNTAYTIYGNLGATRFCAYTALGTMQNAILYHLASESAHTLSCVIDNETTKTYNIKDGYTWALLTPEKDGAVFLGWATSAEGEVVYADGADYTMPAANATLYAKWRQQTVAPVFTTDLNAAYNCNKGGAAVTLTVEATDADTYQWYKNTTATTAGATAIAGATEASYDYTGTTIGTEYVYCVATNAIGSTTSTIASVETKGSNLAVLSRLSFSNGFDAFITSDKKVTGYYMAGTTAPSVNESSIVISDDADYEINGNTVTVLAEDGETMVDYTIVLAPVTPTTTAANEATFDGTETWVKTGYGWDATKGWKFSKNTENDGVLRITDGRNRQYWFVGPATQFTLINGGVTSARAIKVYVNGVEQNGITSAPKNDASPNSITITGLSATGNNMIAIVSNQTGGDGGFTKYTLVPAAPTTATITINPACTDGAFYYATYSNTSAWVVPGDIFVSEVLVIGNEIDFEDAMYEEGDIVPANTGVLVYALEGGDYEVELSNEAGESVLGDDNALRGTGDGITAAEMAAADADMEYFRLTMHNSTQCGFWWGAENGAAFGLGPNKAYLVADAASLSGSFRGWNFSEMENGHQTAISELSKETVSKVMYDLQGRRANGKGLMIQNGKVVLVK